MYFGRAHTLLAATAAAVAAAGAPSSVDAFNAAGGSSTRTRSGTHFVASARADRTGTSSLSAALLSLELEKPLGMILEEVDEGEAKGVKVEELVDSGSAYASEYRDKLVGLKVAKVMGEDVTAVGFDDVMEKIIRAPSPVKIEFELDELAETTSVAQFDVGDPVTITVIQDGAETQVDAKVGDNLRKTLLENNVELYRGLKKKLGNCGGVGQCTYCAVDFVEGEGWEPRSEYEEGKIGKYPNARLACMNNIQGPAKIRIQ